MYSCYLTLIVVLLLMAKCHSHTVDLAIRAQLSYRYQKQWRINGKVGQIYVRNYNS